MASTNGLQARVRVQSSAMGAISQRTSQNQTSTPCVTRSIKAALTSKIFISSSMAEVIATQAMFFLSSWRESIAQTQPGVFALDGKNRKELANVPNSQPPHPFHSLLGLNFERFREFICFHSDQIYPEYIIAYQRCDK
jgi:hypothetical protein